MTRTGDQREIAARKISVPTKRFEMAAACGDAGARVNALAVYGSGIATPTTGAAQKRIATIGKAESEAQSVTLRCGLLQADVCGNRARPNTS